jgi:hypothetical protein
LQFGTNIVLAGKIVMVSKTEDLKINLGLSLADLIEAIKALKPEDKELFIESILAATSSEYLESIKRSRQKYQDGKVFTFNQVFKKK